MTHVFRCAARAFGMRFGAALGRASGLSGGRRGGPHPAFGARLLFGAAARRSRFTVYFAFYTGLQERLFGISTSKSASGSVGRGSQTCGFVAGVPAGAVGRTLPSEPGSLFCCKTLKKRTKKRRNGLRLAPSFQASAPQNVPLRWTLLVSETCPPFMDRLIRK